MNILESLVGRAVGKWPHQLKQFVGQGTAVRFKFAGVGFAASVQVGHPPFRPAVVRAHCGGPELRAGWLEECLKKHLAHQCMIRDRKRRLHPRLLTKAGDCEPRGRLDLEPQGDFSDIMQRGKRGRTGWQQSLHRRWQEFQQRLRHATDVQTMVTHGDAGAKFTPVGVANRFSPEMEVRLHSSTTRRSFDPVALFIVCGVVVDRFSGSDKLWD